MTVLSVNVNKIAVLRNSRDGGRPSVIDAARTVLAAGAAGITVHPRPDQRHIRPADVHDLAELLAGDYPGIEFNIEGNPAAPPTRAGYPGFDALIDRARPAQATLVPDSDDQLTSDHGWDLRKPNDALADTIARYQSWGARVSLFMDPDLKQIDAAKAHGADRIELYTGPYAHTVSRHGLDHAETRASFAAYDAAAAHAASIGLGVNAGHDLDLENLPLFARLQRLDEVSIGHALISDALIYGLFETTRKYLDILATP